LLRVIGSYLPKGVISTLCVIGVYLPKGVIYLKVLLALCALSRSLHYNLSSKWHRHDCIVIQNAAWNLLRCIIVIQSAAWNNPMQICVIPFIAGCPLRYHPVYSGMFASLPPVDKPSVDKDVIGFAALQFIFKVASLRVCSHSEIAWRRC